MCHEVVDRNFNFLSIPKSFNRLSQKLKVKGVWVVKVILIESCLVMLVLI
jgi:hypothetical protein